MGWDQLFGVLEEGVWLVVFVDRFDYSLEEALNEVCPMWKAS